MPRGDLTIVPVEDDDADLRTWLAVRNAVNDAWPISEDEVRHYRTLAPRRVDLLARLDDVPAGAALVGVRSSAHEASHVFAGLWVLPEHRRRGAGTALLSGVSRVAGEWGKAGLECLAYETWVDGLAYMGRRGYEEVARQLAVHLELADVDPLPVDPPAGIEIVTLAARPDLDRGMWEVESEARPDVPAAEPERVPPYEEWRVQELDDPSFRADGCFLAVEDGRVVGVAQLGFPGLRPDVAGHAMTGVRRADRGRGIAGALKRAQVAWAKAAGFRVLETENEERNEPIRRLNRRLGYTPAPAWITLRGPLVP